jgi:two-component system CheB/CheR fusion protein
VWNSGAERLLGYAEAEIIGHFADVIFTPEDRATHRPEIEREQALTEGRASDQRWHLRKDGTRFWSNGFLMPMHDATGHTVGFVKILRDETDTRQAQEALERSRGELVDALQEKDRAWKEAETASKAKDHFMAVLSHELRTPLTPVLLVSQMLAQRKDLPLDVPEALEMIANNVQIEARFIDDLLDMTRLARGKLEIVREMVDIHEVLKRAIEVSRADIEGRQQKLVVALRAKQRTITGDRTRLQQVFGISSRTPPNSLPRVARSASSLGVMGIGSPLSFRTMALALSRMSCR